MKFLRIVLCFLPLLFSAALCAQDTASITGTVRDSSGAVVAGASVTITSTAIGLLRTTSSNSSGDYLAAGLPAGTYDVVVSAPGFQEFQTRGFILRVAQKTRIDGTLTVGSVNSKVVVDAGSTAEVETQSAEIAGTITGKELTQLELNGRNFTQLATLMPGVTNQSGQDEGQVGLTGNVQFSVNGGRTEYNNWELDGGDNMDNGSNTTLNIFPSLDAIDEVRVLTSNYGAQYGRNASGTIEVETKSGTNAFHGDVYEFVRNDLFNARNFFDMTPKAPEYKKNDFGYTIGGPVFIPHRYNTDKSKTFFFWSQEWRKEVVPGQTFLQPVPSSTERMGNFTDLCPDPGGTFNDCPVNPATGQFFPGNQVTVDPNAQALLAEIPAPNTTASCGGIACFAASPSQPTDWREELVRLDHNLNDKNRLMFRYIHDSWTSINPIVLPFGPTTSSFPNIQTREVVPGLGLVARLTTTASPTLVNEFVFSYTTDHLHLTNIGPWQLPPGLTIGSIFNNGFGGKLPGITVTGNNAYGQGFTEDASFIPFSNSNPTYTYRDNVSKIIGKHNLQFGAYFVAAQKNEPSVFDDNGLLTFQPSNTTVTTGNAFADLLIGNITSFTQTNKNPKYYNRYKIFEPYIQDDWHVTPHLTVNIGLRVSLFGTYREKYHQAYNWEASAYNPAKALAVDPTTGALIDPITLQPVTLSDPRVFNGIVQCGVGSIPAGCMKGHLFNPAPRFGFAWDPWGDARTSIRGGYGIFFEHTNGNEANTESLEGAAPSALTSTQSNIVGYANIGGGGLVFPLGVTAIPTRAIWPYVQQWNLSVEHDVFKSTVASIAYVGSKGTHLNYQTDLNQLPVVSSAANPYLPGEPIITPSSAPGSPPPNTFCPAAGQPNPIVNGQVVTGQTAINVNVAACGAIADPFRPFVGFGDINLLQNQADSSYNSLQLSLRRTTGPLILDFAYTYSHSIDDSSDRFDNAFVNSMDRHASRASSQFDQRQVMSLSYVYTLPFFNHATGWRRTTLGGWEVSGITTVQTGTPFTVVNQGNGVISASDNAGVGNGVGSGSFPDVVGNPNSTPPPVPPGSSNFGPLLGNPAAFVAPRGLTFGNAGRDIVRNPRRTNFDAALFKRFALGERASFELRAEAFNLFNHTQFYTVSAVGNGSSGNNAISCYGNTNNSAGDPACLSQNSFLYATAAHRARTLQLALKLLF